MPVLGLYEKYRRIWNKYRLRQKFVRMEHSVSNQVVLACLYVHVHEYENPMSGERSKYYVISSLRVKSKL